MPQLVAAGAVAIMWMYYSRLDVLSRLFAPASTTLVNCICRRNALADMSRQIKVFRSLVVASMGSRPTLTVLHAAH